MFRWIYFFWGKSYKLAFLYIFCLRVIKVDVFPAFILPSLKFSLKHTENRSYSLLTI